MKNFVILLTAIICFGQIKAKTKEESECQEGNPPGPKDSEVTDDHGGIIPSFYDLSLKLPVSDPTMPSKYMINGNMTMRFRANRQTKYIYVMSQEIHIDTDQITLHEVDSETTAEPIKLTYKCLDTVRHSLILKPEVPLEAQTQEESSFYELKIRNFASKIRERGEGAVFFETEGQTNTTFSIVTQFQTEYARKAFPCIDIPQFKANFKIKLLYPAGAIALSNMPPVARGKDESGWEWTQFNYTPWISTYLVAFAVRSSHQQATSQTVNSVNLTVYAGSYKQRAQDLLKEAVFCLNDLDDQLQVSLPREKIDIVVISGFPTGIGGMENEGMITLNVTTLETVEFAKAIQFRVQIVAHELAHHWFGNLVTVRNWKYLAVQEGATAYFGDRAMRNYFTRRDNSDVAHLIWLSNHFLSIKRISGNKASTESLMFGYSASINGAEKAYGKAGYIIGNIESMVGEEKFLRQIREFLKQYQTRNFDLNDFKSFFAQFTYNVDNKTLSAADVYEFWFTHGGVPTLMVERNYADNTVHIYSTDHHQVKWPIPLNFQVVNSGKTGFYPELIIGEGRFSLADIADESKALIANPGGMFFYPVIYDLRNTELLLKQVAEQPESLTFRTKAHIVFNFCLTKDRIKEGSSLWSKYGERIMKQPNMGFSKVYCSQNLSALGKRSNDDGIKLPVLSDDIVKSIPIM